MQIFQIFGRGWVASVAAKTKRDAVLMFSDKAMFGIRETGFWRSGKRSESRCLFMFREHSLAL